MRVLVASDIHANLAALDAVLRDAGAVEAVWCLGDTVGYGPQPRECISRLRQLGALWVAGNHERAATGAIGTSEFNPDAAAAAEWTKGLLAETDAAFLDALPEVATEGQFTLVHGSLRDPIWEYLYSEEAALAHFGIQETPHGLVGHTHVPLVAIEDRTALEGCQLFRLRDGETVDLEDGPRTIINPGSVGQPRDGDNRAAYAVYDSDAATVTLRRVEYEINATQTLMMDAGLPRWLIDRLAQGR
jgi:predicted phosphodiesterase